MNRQFFISFFALAYLFLTATVYGQAKPPKGTSIDILYGQKFLSHKTFNGELNTIDHLKFGGNLSYIGIGMSAELIVQRGTYFNHFGNLYYTQIIPQKIMVNDTITAHITGFNFGFTLYGVDLFPQQKYFNTYITIGANTGRLRMYGNSFVTQKNPYFSPKLRVAPTLNLGKMRVYLHLEYEYDISRKNWRRTNTSKSDKLNLVQTSNTGFTILAGVGYILGGNKTHKNGGIKVE